MPDKKPFQIPDTIDSYFKDNTERTITLYLLESIFYNDDYPAKPEVTAKTWRDAENLVRLINKRDTAWPWINPHFVEVSGYEAISKYAIIYIVNHLSNSEIREALSDFFSQKGKVRLTEVLKKKLKVNVLDFLMDNKKYTITKKDFEKSINDFNYIDPFAYRDIFEYPRHLEFDDEAFNMFASDVYCGNTYKAEYFLGATDDLKGYDRWFYLCRHILMTASDYDYDCFSLASIILEIIRSTIDPKDKKTIAWLKDQIFNIFWPRVDGLWPIIHQRSIAENTVLRDSIDWIVSLDDLKERLPKLPDNVELDVYNFKENNTTQKLTERIKTERKNIKKISTHLKQWPDRVSAFNNPEFLTEIKPEYIIMAVCERDDPWYEKVASPWRMKLELTVNGKQCEAHIDDQVLYRRYYDAIVSSNEFDCDSEIPMQYGRETFTRKTKKAS